MKKSIRFIAILATVLCLFFSCSDGSGGDCDDSTTERFAAPQDLVGKYYTTPQEVISFRANGEESFPDWILSYQISIYSNGSPGYWVGSYDEYLGEGLYDNHIMANPPLHMRYYKIWFDDDNNLCIKDMGFSGDDQSGEIITYTIGLPDNVPALP